MAGLVYFIQSGDDGPIKIGYTTSINTRLPTLQTAHPWVLHVIGTVPGSVLDEARAHNALAEYRMIGEWFRPEAEVRTRIREWIAAGRVPASIFAQQGKTTLRNFRIPDDEYARLLARVKDDASYPNATAVVRKILREYVGGIDEP